MRTGGRGWTARQVPALALAALAGCATVAPPPAGPAFDGAYVGQTALLRGGGYVCGVPDEPRSLTVRDGRFVYPFQMEGMKTVPMTVQVAVDGTFNAQMQYFTYDEMPVGPQVLRPWVTVTGRIANGTLEAVEDDHRCARRSVLHRR